MKKKLLTIAMLLSINLISVLFSSAVKAESAYAPYPSNKANILGTGLRIENTINDYDVSIPIQYESTNDGNFIYRGTATAANMYTTIGSNGIAPVGTVTNATPFVPSGISKPVSLPDPPKTINFLSVTKYFHYYVVQTVNDSYPNKGNNYAFNAGDILPTNALFAWAYYSDSPGITINYKTTDGDTLDNSITYFGELGDKPSVTEKYYNGYTISQVPQVGTFTEQEQSYDYIYTKQAKLGADVTVKYVDTLGNTIADNKILSGNIGDSYQTEQLPINGYTFKESSGNISGTFTDQEQTVTYVYTKDPVAGGSVTAKYVDTSGNAISDNVVKTGNIGDTYSTEQKTIPGYTFKEVQGSISGQFTGQEQAVTYVYTKDIAPVKPTVPTTTDSHSSSTWNLSTTSEHTLPSTGEKYSVWTVILGVAIALMATAFYILKRKKVSK